jgi:hypothetical protein
LKGNNSAEIMYAAAIAPPVSPLLIHHCYAPRCKTNNREEERET